MKQRFPNSPVVVTASDQKSTCFTLFDLAKETVSGCEIKASNTSFVSLCEIKEMCSGALFNQEQKHLCQTEDAQAVSEDEKHLTLTIRFFILRNHPAP